MATTKSVHIAEVQLKTTGLEKINTAFDNMAKIIPTKSLNLTLQRVRGDVTTLVTEINKQITTGTFDFSKLDLGKVSRGFANFYDQVAKAQAKGQLGEKIAATFDLEIDKLQGSVIKITEKIKESQDAVESYKAELATLKATDEIKDIYKTPAGLAKRTAFLEERVGNEKTRPADKKRFEIELEALKKYAEQYKAINKKIEEEGRKQTKFGEEMVIKNEEISKKRAEQATAKSEVPEVAALNEVYEDLVKHLQQVSEAYKNQAQQKHTKDTKDATKAVKDLEKEEKKHEKTLGGKILTGVSYYVVFNKIKQLYRDMVRTVTELDKAMTTVAMVTSMNRKEAWQLLGTYQSLAKQVGITTSEIANLSVYFFRQGRNIKDAMVLTEIAAKSARVAGINAEEAANYLTSAVNGFGLAAEQASEVADKFAQLAASSASSFEELAIAMSKVAPVAQSAGISIDFMMGVLAKGIETTREAPENIGTAFKTVFARMREITDIGKATEDGMSVNRVEKALASIGVALRTADGQFRNLEEVLMDVGYQWKNLSSIEQAYLATALAGTRQQPRLLAIFNDFERTTELIEISRESAGAMSMQHIEYMEGMEAATANLKTAWEEFITTFASSEVIIGVFKSLGDTISWLAGAFSKLGSAGQLMVTTFAALTAAIMLSKIRIIAETVATYKNAASKMYLALSQRIVNTLAAKSGAAIIMNTQLTRASILMNAKASVSNIGLAATLKTVGAALWASLGPYVLVAAAAAAVVGVVALLIKEHKEATKSLEDYNKQITKNNKLMYENNQKSQSLEKLISEYDHLNKKLVKTQEELEKIKDLQSQLAEFDTGENGPKFTQEFGGSTIVNTAEVERYQKEIANQNEVLLAENVGSIRAALVKNLDITDSQEMIATMNDLGYAMVEKTIDGIEDANLKKKVNDAFVQGFSEMDYGDYTSRLITEGINDEEGSDLENISIGLWKDWENNLYNTKEEAEKAMAEQRKNFNWWQRNISKNRKWAKEATLVESTEYQKLNDDLLEKTHTFRLELLQDFYTKQAKNELDNSKNARALLQNNLDNYNSQLAKINNNPELSESIKKDLIATLEYNMRDEANLKMLVEEKQIPLSLVVKAIELGSTMDEVAGLIDGIETLIGDKMSEALSAQVNAAIAAMGSGAFRGGSTSLTQMIAAQEDVKKQAIEAVDAILQSSSTNIGGKVNSMEALLKSAGLDDKTIKTIVANVVDMKTQTAQGIMENILDTQKMAGGFTDLLENMGKGDFSGFGELSEEFGLDNIQAFISGEKTINQLFDDRVSAYKEELRLRINALKAQDSLSEIEQTELAQLELMLNNYDLLNISAISRQHVLNSTLAIIEKMNKAVELQNSLLEAGFTQDSAVYNFFKEFGDMAEEMATQGMNSTVDQYIGDIAAIKAEMSKAGMLDENFNLINLDSMTADQATLFASYQSLMDEFGGATEEFLSYIDSIYAAQRKEIEEMYETEINLLKDANTERWKEIDYANSLLDLQDKILASREKLIGMQLEGGNSGNIEQARKDLQSLQRERQKMIEQKMVEDAEKQLQQERDDRLAALQTQQIDAMTVLTDGINSLNTTIAGLLNRSGSRKTIPQLFNGYEGSGSDFVFIGEN